MISSTRRKACTGVSNKLSSELPDIVSLEQGRTDKGLKPYRHGEAQILDHPDRIREWREEAQGRSLC